MGNEDKPGLVNESHEELLNSTFIGTLSTVRHNDGRISTNPVSYIWNGQEIEISTLKGRMIRMRGSITLGSCGVMPKRRSRGHGCSRSIIRRGRMTTALKCRALGW